MNSTSFKRPALNKAIRWFISWAFLKELSPNAVGGLDVDDACESLSWQHFLNFFPLPQGHGSFLPGFTMFVLGSMCWRGFYRYLFCLAVIRAAIGGMYREQAAC
jgi:hypothetical protein